IAKRLRSNVRELEGALNRVIANANFTGRAITIDFVREALRDLLALNPGEDAISIDDVEPAKELFKRFDTAAMSIGALSP
ncbi:hypothetical protein FPK47_30645, partial [Acinetobacter baumannii]|nr:hypothetical protein [Acinetobacter baumannii]